MKSIHDVNSAIITMGTIICLLCRFIKKLIHILNVGYNNMNGFIIQYSCATSSNHTQQMAKSAM